MTEIPADLLEALARELAPYDFGPRDTTSDRHEPPRVLLAALAECPRCGGGRCYEEWAALRDEARAVLADTEEAKR